MPLVHLSDISKSFPDGEKGPRRVLCELSLSVSSGEFVAIRGASGSGKTTLLSILGTLLQPDAGSYLLNGEDLLSTRVSHARARNQRIGFVFQEHRLLPQLCAADNILLPALAFAAKPDSDTVAYAHTLMALTGIASVATQLPHTLSGGEASRVALCRALVMRPLLLLADEPTGQLDSGSAQSIIALLADVNKTTRTTIIMVTHSDEAAAAADRTLLLKDGRLSTTATHKL
ncbi:MAG: ABC transporter ATP-binding protein [Prevotellaceae bacterium]|jgi:ABC-type lipoprotein export system ATPase subunit|nr:ABC transporter ATP-binding protein [Prevotellaceae bacterium]